MADQRDLDFSYSLIDRIFRLSFGETADFSCAKYDGDFSLTLEQAQRQKHEYIFSNLNLREGERVIDLGCGWGPFLVFLREKGIRGTGVTLSEKQAESCRKNGLDVHLLDCRAIKTDTLGVFDAAVSVEAFEHFSTKEEWRTGYQEEVYSGFFKHVHDLLQPNGRFYLQTGTLTDRPVDFNQSRFTAEKHTDEYICALLSEQFPGSWPAKGDQQIISVSEPYFNLVHKESGRLDYIETQNQWRKRYTRFNVKKYMHYVSLFSTCLINNRHRERILLHRANANRICFERGIMDLHRFVFERK